MFQWIFCAEIAHHPPDLSGKITALPWGSKAAFRLHQPTRGARNLTIPRIYIAIQTSRMNSMLVAREIKHHRRPLYQLLQANWAMTSPII